MTTVENLSESTNESLENNEWKAADVITQADKTVVNNAVEDINLNKSPMEYFWLNTDTEKNIITSICGKENINQITMKDIFELPSLKKSQLAWELSALKQISWKELGVDLWKLNNVIKWGENMSIDNLNSSMGVNLNQWEWYYIFKQLKDIHNRKSRNEYVKMFKVWDKIPPMQEISTLATGDLSGTAGIWWWLNAWRIYFDYDFKNSNTIERSLNFWALKWPAEILISANWINVAKDWKGWGSFDFIFDNWWIVHWDYTSEWLIVDEKSLPAWIERKDWVLIIPDTYKNIPITIGTKSNKYSNGTYDEVMFNFSCKNASISRIATKMDDVDWDRNFWLWEYQSSPNEQNDFWAWINAVTNATKNSFAENIPVTFWVTIDKAKFNPQKIDWFMQRTSDFSFDKVMENYNGKDKNQLKNISINAFNNFKSKIDVSNFQWELEQKAQQRLAECRFWEALWIALKQWEFRKQLLSWKIQIDPQFSVWAERKITTSVQEQDLIAIKK